MSSAAFLVAWEKDAWCIAASGRDGCEVRRLPAAAVGGPAGSAPDAAAALKEMGYKHRGICLGLPSEVVLAAQIDCGGLPRRNRLAAMLYRLEEQLPIEAERLTADFLAPSGGLALGVAAETGRVKEVIDALAAGGVETGAVCPTSLLALWDSCSGRSSEADYAVVCWGSNVDLFRLADGRPAAWYTMGDDPEDLVRSLQADMLQSPVGSDARRLLVIGELGDEAAERISRQTSLEVLGGRDESALVPAARSARTLLAGRSAGWVNLRRDGLAMPDPWQQVARPAKAAIFLLLLLLAGLAAMFYWRSVRYDALASESKRGQAAIYRSVYPNTKVPPNVKSRLKSQWKRLAGVSGTGCELPREPNALDTLRLLVANLPPAIRLRIEKVRIDPHSVHVEGQTRTHSDAERIAQALRQGGLGLGAPRTEYLARGGVAFRLTGTPSGDEPVAARGVSGK